MRVICCVCLDWDSVPKSLPCLHVVCTTCLRKLVRHRMLENSSPVFGILQTPSVSCPTCRHKFITCEEKVDDFPAPLVCTRCGSLVKQVVEMSCGHRNENICLDCLQQDSGEKVSCPKCGVISPRNGMPRMHRCNECHKFSTSNCNGCITNLIRPKLNPVTSRYLFDEMFPNIDRQHSDTSWLTVGLLIFLIAAILAILCTTRATSRESMDSISEWDNVCCTITTWHVDERGRIDTTWCSGDDWKLKNAKCTEWPPEH